MKIAIIDLDSVAYFIGHPNKILDEDGQPKRTEDNSKFLYKEKTEKELIESCNYMMNKILQNGEFSGYIGYIKGIDTILKRKNINNDYKANRSKETPNWWGFVKDYLIHKWMANSVDYMEVDDAVNITRLKLKNSHIVAIDKDLLHLEGLHYNWNKNEWVTINKKDSEIQFWQDMVVGQPVDNVKGIIGKGIKYFEKICLDIKEGDFLRDKIFQAYVNEFGESLGISEFYKNYHSLKIKDEDDQFIIPEINWIDVKKEGVENWRKI